MAGSRNQNKSNGRRRSNKQSSSVVESGQSRALNRPLLPVNSDRLLSEEQVEKFLQKKLEAIYKEALTRLISYGYGHDEALDAILANGLVFGDSDVLTNIVKNSLSHIKTGQVLDDATRDFADIRILVDYSLTEMIKLLHQIRPNLSKRQAMWCLYLSKFQLGVADAKRVPFATIESLDSGKVCREEETKPLKRFNLTPYLVCQLKKNVAEYAAAYRVDLKVSSEPQPPQPSKDPLDGFEWEEVLDDEDRPESEAVSSLVDEIKEIKKELKERKEWAQRKVIQSAEKLTSVVIELGSLRMERVKIQQDKDRELETEEARVKVVTEMEDALREVTRQAAIADGSVKRLEGENAQIKAEMEAFKLDASESNKLRLEAGRKERKLLRKITALKKQNNKLQEEIAEERNTSLQLQQQLTRIKKAQEDIEVSWRQELEAKELSITQVQAELRLKEEYEVELKRKQEAMYQKMDIDCQCYKDEVQRLEQEIYNLQLSSEPVAPYHLPAVLISELQLERSQRNILATSLPDLSLLPDISEETYNRTCLMCMEKEASVVFLPCAHQVLCARCNEGHRRNVGCRCPCCQALISQTISVYGTSS